MCLPSILKKVKSPSPLTSTAPPNITIPAPSEIVILEDTVPVKL